MAAGGSQGSSVARQRLGKVLLLVGSLGLSLVAGEFVVRLWEAKQENQVRPWPGLSPEMRGLPELKGMFALTKPNQKGVFKRAIFRTNRDGFRGPDYERVPPEGTYRVVLVGDSFTMGSGVDEEDTYAARLAGMLNVADGSRRHEVLNLGVGGFNLRASVGRLQRTGVHYQPNLLIYGWTPNDIEGPSYRNTFQPKRGWMGSALWNRLRNWWESFRRAPGTYRYELDENYFRNPGAWNYFLQSLDDFARIVAEREVCGVVFLHTHLLWLASPNPAQPFEDAVAQAAEARGLFVIRSFPDFEGLPEKTLWIGPGDSHPNERGHEILATALFRGLEALPPRCGLALPESISPIGSRESAP